MPGAWVASFREMWASLQTSDTGRAAAMGGAVMGANVLALAFTVVFARLLGADGYGSLAALLSTFLILSVPGSAIQVTVAREVSAHVAAGDPSPAAGVQRWLRHLTYFTVALAAVGVLGREALAGVIGVEELPWAAAATLPTGALWLLLSVERGALQGLQRYRLVGWSVITEATARLAAAVALVEAAGLGVSGAFLGTTGSLLATVVILLIPLERAIHAAGPPTGEEDRPLRELMLRAWAPVSALALIAVLQNIDVIVVKHVADDDAAGAYASAAVAAKAVIWIAVGLGYYLLPESARRARLGEDARPILARTLGLIAFVAVPMVLLYAAVAGPFLEIAFGDEDFRAAAGALPWLGLAMTGLAAVYLAVQYLLALGRSAFLVVLAAAAVVEPLLVLGIGADLTQVALALLALEAVLAAVLLALASRSVEVTGGAGYQPVRL